jgi:hypothetical protein
MHADIFSQQKLDSEKQFQNFAHGIASSFFFSSPLDHFISDILLFSLVQVFPQQKGLVVGRLRPESHSPSYTVQRCRRRPRY